MGSHGVVTVRRDNLGRSESTHAGITVSFHYVPCLFTKVKTIDGRKWHPLLPVIASPVPKAFGTGAKQSQFAERNEILKTNRRCVAALFNQLRRQYVLEIYN